jgi:septum formation protein
MTRRLVLASASAARLQLLRSAGLDPEVTASNLAEDDVEAVTAPQIALVLARLKAEAVSARLSGEGDPPLVIGCDSLLEFDGESWGKPAAAGEVRERWARMRGRSGVLYTGHCLVDNASGRQACELDSAVVHFGMPDDAEIEAYARSPEALAVAGPFTLEGLSSAWVDSIEGNYGTVAGISLPVLRRLLAKLDVRIVDLWRYHDGGYTDPA